jgi:exopolysaccharide biosynthesis protein
MIQCIVSVGLLLVAALPAWGQTYDGGFKQLSEGLELARFKVAHATPVGDSTVVVLRIDPRLWNLTMGCASTSSSGRNMTAKEWAEEYGLVAVINAGMFNADHRTHTGFMKAGDHLNNPQANEYQSAAAFEPTKPGLPEFHIFALDETPLDSIRGNYATVVQNLRLIKRPGNNRWSQQPKKWSEAALGEDAEGRILFIFCRSPYSMHDLNRILLSLPMDLVAAQHLEGGPEAQIFIDYEDQKLDLVGSYETDFFESDDNHRAWQIPNAIGAKPTR